MVSLILVAMAAQLLLSLLLFRRLSQRLSMQMHMLDQELPRLTSQTLRAAELQSHLGQLVARQNLALSQLQPSAVSGKSLELIKSEMH